MIHGSFSSFALTGRELGVVREVYEQEHGQGRLAKYWQVDSAVQTNSSNLQVELHWQSHQQPTMRVAFLLSKRGSEKIDDPSARAS